MLYRIKTELYRARTFIARSKKNGLSLPYILFIHIPRAFNTLLYLKLAKRFNDKVLSTTINKIVIRSFHQKQSANLGNHFYVIVMPNTLHYLIPCLRLLPEDLNVFLVFNGAKHWEQQLIKNEFNNRPSFKLLTLPGSSINHGEVLNLFFYANDKNFGIIDHDLYIFDSNIFKQLGFENNQSMKAIFSGENQNTKMPYPHTFFLFFNTPVIKKIMDQYQIDARIYKKLPKNVESPLLKIGLSNRQFIKDYQNFFDTLHVILGLSYTQNLDVDYIDTNDVYHLGGTSMGSQYTKDLSHMYISMCFLEHVNNPLLTEKYLPYLSPFENSEQIEKKLSQTAEVRQMKNVLHSILELIHKNSTQDKQ